LEKHHVTVHDRGPVQFIPGALALFNQITFQISYSTMLLISEEHSIGVQLLTYSFRTQHLIVFNLVMLNV
jgi:hypothetical protein